VLFVGASLLQERGKGKGYNLVELGTWNPETMFKSFCGRRALAANVLGSIVKVKRIRREGAPPTIFTYTAET